MPRTRAHSPFRLMCVSISRPFAPVRMESMRRLCLWSNHRLSMSHFPVRCLSCASSTDKRVAGGKRTTRSPDPTFSGYVMIREIRQYAISAKGEPPPAPEPLSRAVYVASSGTWIVLIRLWPTRLFSERGSVLATLMICSPRCQVSWRRLTSSARSRAPQ